MNTEKNETIKINFRNVVRKLKIPENYDVLPAEKEETIEFIVETYE